MLGELRLLRLGGALGGDWEAAGPQIVAGFKKLCKNPLGKPRLGIKEIQPGRGLLCKLSPKEWA